MNNPLGMDFPLKVIIWGVGSNYTEVGKVITREGH